MEENMAYQAVVQWKRNKALNYTHDRGTGTSKDGPRLTMVQFTTFQLPDDAKENFGRLRRVDHLRSGVQEQPDQHGKTPSLLKIQKLAGRGGGCLQSQLLRRLRQENCSNLGGRGCNEPRSCYYTPAWATRAKLSLKQKKKKKISHNNNI
ncbi:Zinc finger protein 714 [Plecturocebus cupreus]